MKPRNDENLEGRDVEVVPADLARELYKAVKALRYARSADAFSAALTRGGKAQARYEREVGSDENPDAQHP